MMPQSTPSAAQVVGTHSHFRPAVQTSTYVLLDGQLPHSKEPPHPSSIVPHVAPCVAHTGSTRPAPAPHSCLTGAFSHVLGTHSHVLSVQAS